MDESPIPARKGSIGLEEDSSGEVRSRRNWFAAWWYRLQRQELVGWRPYPIYTYVLTLYAMLCLVMGALGGVFLWLALKQVDVRLRYDTAGPFAALNNDERSALLMNAAMNASVVPTNVTLRITEHMDAPIYIYYRLDKYYQNNKRYVKSVNFNQLHGKGVSGSSLSTCDPKKQIDTTLINSTEAASLPDGGVINPCGLAPWSFFNDTFSNFAVTTRSGAVSTLTVDSSRLVWKSDRDTFYGDYQPVNFNNVPGLEGGGDIAGNVSQDEHFMAWMKFSAAPNVLKFYGKIDQDLHRGDKVTISVGNAYNLYGFGGKKWIILTTSGPVGGHDITFGVVWLGAAVIWGLASIVMCVAGLRRGLFVRRNREQKIKWLQSELSWNKNKRMHIVEAVTTDNSMLSAHL